MISRKYKLPEFCKRSECARHNTRPGELKEAAEATLESVPAFWGRKSHCAHQPCTHHQLPLAARATHRSHVKLLPGTGPWRAEDFDRAKQLLTSGVNHEVVASMMLAADQV